MTERNGLPTGWEKIPLAQVADRIIVGLAMGITQYYAGEGVVLLRNQNIRPDRFDGSDILYLTDEFAATQKSKKLRAGDVITVRTGANIGDTCVVPDEFAGSLTFTTLITSPSPKKLDSRFLSYYVNSSFGRSEVNRLMAGGGKGNLNSTELKKLVLIVPPFAEQQRIAAILSTWDRAIELTEKLIAAKQQRKAALMQQLLTGKVRLPGFTDMWKTEQLGKLVTIKKGQQANRSTLADEGQYPVMNGGVAPSGYLDRFNTETNTVCISEGGNSCGFVSLMRTPFWSGGHNYTLLAPTPSIEFLFQSLKYHESRIMGLRVGSGLPNIQKHRLAAFQLTLPSPAEQQAIAAILSVADEEIALHRRKLDALRRQKKGLMQQLLTGKVRVKVTESSGE